MSKQNDLMFTLLGNPLLTTEDFLKVGLSADNTSLENESVYTSLKEITENSLFLNDNGEFDKDKFHLIYLGASLIMYLLADSTNLPKAVYSKYNIFAPLELRNMSPQFELVLSANPDRITKSMITIGRSGEREYTPAEIALSQQVYNSTTGAWMDTPENLFSINKLFSDFSGFFTDNFGSTKVLALYEEDVDINGNKRGEAGFDENLIEHYKGEYMLNDNGTYYYRTLKDGENIYGKLVLHFSDVLTREGSALNSVDFLDNDDLKKSTFGAFIKNAALVAPLVLGTGFIGAPTAIGALSTWILGATIFLQAAGLGATLGKIALGSDNSTMNWIEGLVEATNPMKTRSEYSSGDKMWTTENILGMAADVIAQLALQRMIFKWAPLITKGKWGLSEKTQEALKTKYTNELLAKNVNSLEKIRETYGVGSYQAEKAAAEALLKSLSDAAALVESYMKDYYKSGEVLSKAYMTMLTVNDIYGEAKEAGAGDFDAAIITAGYAAAEYALLSTDIGKWILPELRAARLENKAMVRALSKETIEAFKKLGVEATTSESAKRNYLQKLVDFGKNVAKGEFNAGLGKRAAFKDGEGLLKAGFGSLLAGASAEAVEETTEEVLADFSRVIFNGLLSLKGTDTRMQAPWEDEHLFDRYAMSFLGGFLGGGVSSATFDFSQARRAVNMTYDLAVQLAIWKARNNELGEIDKLLNKETIANKYLSARKTKVDENGNTIWQEGNENDNLDTYIKNLIRTLLRLIQDTLNAHGGNLTDLSLLDAQVLRDLRYRALQNTTTAGIYILKFNNTLVNLIEKTSRLRLLNSTESRAERGETDKEDRTTGEPEAVTKLKQKLEKEIKELDEQIENFTSGRLAPMFMASALIESTPFIAKTFIRSSFRTFAENKAHTQFENIPEGELKSYLELYQNYLRTSKKDDLEFATEGYLSLLRMVKANLEEAVKVALETVDDSELKELLTSNSEDLSRMVSSLADSDSWQEAYQNYINSNGAVETFNLVIQDIFNNEDSLIKKHTEKRDSDIALFKKQLDDGLIDEELYNNSVEKSNKELEDLISSVKENTKLNLAYVDTSIWLEQANKLADKFIKVGYINGAIKDLVISKLNELVSRLESHKTGPLYTQMEENEDDYSLLDKYLDLDANINALKNKIDLVLKLKYTPILQNLDQFALNLNGSTISKVLEELNRAIQTNKTNIQSFTFSNDIHHAINEAERVIDLYIAALEGARTDAVDPLNPALDDIWGINRVLNEVHAKAPRVENDTWEDLPEIDGESANMMLMDARSIKNTLLSYKKLFNINRGLKLEIQSRVGARTSYLLYDRIRRLLTNANFPKDLEGSTELQEILDNLKFFNDNVLEKDPKDWKISLNVEEQVALEKDRLAMEDALYEFFNKNLDNLESIFNVMLFNLGDSRTTLLTESAEDIDESSIVGYLASKIAIKSSDFYSKYKELIKSKDPAHPIAPILGLELGVLLGLANILNGQVVTKVIQAYRNSIYSYVKNLKSFDSRMKFLLKIGLSRDIAILMSTETGFNKFFGSYDLVPQYANITFVDGVAGSGKTSAIDALVIKYLQKYNPETLKKVWTIHGGDSNDSTEFAKGLRTAVGLPASDSDTFNRDSFMNTLTPDRATLPISDDGKSYEFRPTDYVFLNGKIVSTWRLADLSELPTLMIIDEALLFTQLDLLTIDKFARKYGIPVIMSGDLLQTQMDGKIQMTKEDVSAINNEIKTNGISDLLFTDESSLTLRLHRNLVLHTPKIGTSMRTENNQKNMNMAIVLSLMEVDSGNADLHFFEGENDVAGDIWLTPNLTDEVKRLLDKIFGNLTEGEKVNFAYNDENSALYKALKADSKYWDKINPIKGVALGQEGNYWIIDINPELSTASYLLDLYTGLTRAKKASIIVSDKNPKGIEITYNTIKDTETHPEKYSNKAIEKFIDRRVKVLDEALTGEGQDIPYIPRESFEKPLSVESEPTSEEEITSEEPSLESVSEESTISEESSESILEESSVEPTSEEPSLKEPVQLTLEFEEDSENVFPNPNEITEESVSNETETLGKLSESNLENNPKGFELNTINDLSKKGFTFFLFSNATFELGTSQVDRDNDTFIPSSINGRIDSLNGLAKLGITNLSNAEKIIGQLRDLLMSVENKSDLERFIGRLLKLKEIYVRYAIKTSEFSQGQWKSSHKFDKEENEPLPYTRALLDPNSDSNKANSRSLIAIIGTETNGDILELPLLTLNSPITIITATDNKAPRYPLPFDIYTSAMSQGADPRSALVEVVKLLDKDPQYAGLVNLIKIYTTNNRHILFIDDPNWTIGKDLHTFGPLMNISRGKNYFNKEYTQEDRWIPLNELRKDPQLRFSSIMEDTDKSGKIETNGESVVLISLPKHPFVLYTDASVDHEGKVLSSDESLVKEFMWQRRNPLAKLTIKLAYVLPPKFTLELYLRSLVDFTNNNGKFVLGNQRTAYKILEALMLDGNLLSSFLKALGNDIGLAVYEKVRGVIDELKSLTVAEQIRRLTNSTPQSWNIKGFGLQKEVQLYLQLQNVLKLLVNPSASTITGEINFKGANRFNELFPALNEMFEKSGLSMFFQVRASKDASKLIFNRFSPVLGIDTDGNLKNDYIIDGQFYINGNLTTSTFMANEVFNDILEKAVLKISILNFLVNTNDNGAYRLGYSGFNRNSRQPSIAKSILDKLNQFGINTSIGTNVANDDSIELKLAIANEINSNIESAVRAIVLPNGELIIGSNELFKGKQVSFNLGTNSFESQQTYMFEVSIDGVVYDANYSETNSGKNLELTQRETESYFGEWSTISVEAVTLNLMPIQKLLSLISGLNKRAELTVNKLLEIPNSDDRNTEITKFLNSRYAKQAVGRLSKKFDLSEYSNILKFEQVEKGCSVSTNIKFL